MNVMTGWRAKRAAKGAAVHDLHETPRCAVEFLLRHESFVGPIWEPACGHGAISEVLIEHGYDVISRDLIDRGYGTGGCDFLQEQIPAAGCIITNPPFTLALEFALHAIGLKVPKICLLLRSLWTESAERRDTLFLPHPPARVYQISDRLPFMHREGYEGKKLKKGPTPYSWFIWDSAHTGETALRWRPGQSCDSGCIRPPAKKRRLVKGA